MKILLFFLSAFLCFCNLNLKAQTYPVSPDCVEPFPQKYDEFRYVDDRDLKQRVRDFVNAATKAYGDQAKMVVHVYGGQLSRSDEIQSFSETIRKAANLTADRPWIRDMGYRRDASFEFFLRQLECTAYPSGISDLKVDEVEFTDLPAKRLSSPEIGSLIVDQPEAKCPPAARAVRACNEGTIVEVFVVIDKQGNVVFARSINGHPLNIANAAANAKQTKFRKFEISGVATQVSGTIKIAYIKPEEIISH